MFNNQFNTNLSNKFSMFNRNPFKLFNNQFRLFNNQFRLFLNQFKLFNNQLQNQKVELNTFPMKRLLENTKLFTELNRSQEKESSLNTKLFKETNLFQ